MLLTVEEAGVLLRIGRTKAYALAREWRETDGRSGLPVIDLGHILRVPRQALEKLIGADLSKVAAEGRVAQAPTAPTTDSSRETPESPESKPVEPQATRRRGNPKNRIANQLDLFDSKPRPD
ncbi:MAG: helix-turn-helix domain-containing protein [Acidimicrobiia bacterium]